MKLKVEQIKGGKRISWFNDIGVCIATASSGMCEIAGYAHPRIRDAAQAAARELWDNPHADLRHYEGMTLPEDPAEVWPIDEWTKPAARLPITWKAEGVLADGRTLDDFRAQFRQEREGNWTPQEGP